MSTQEWEQQGKMSMKKDILSLAICSVLSIAIMGYVVYWMDDNRTVDSETALIQAKQSLAQFCSKKGMGSCHMILTDASAPVAGKHGWQFEFQSINSDLLSVEVKDNGDTHLLSRVNH